MGNLKTLLVLLLLLPVPGRATEDPLVSAFASCAGRFSAELEHTWLQYDPRSEEIADRRRQFIDLLNAVVAPDRRPDALNMRIDAKMAHAQLLTQATFSQDSDRSAWAERRAQAEISYCVSFLLQG